MTTPHPSPLITCPGCGKAHAPHPELGTWCTAACVAACMRQPSAQPPRRARERKPRA